MGLLTQLQLSFAYHGSTRVKSDQIAVFSFVMSLILKFYGTDTFRNSSSLIICIDKPFFITPERKMFSTAVMKFIQRVSN